jgi:hypothetical protein
MAIATNGSKISKKLVLKYTRATGPEVRIWVTNPVVEGSKPLNGA